MPLLNERAEHVTIMVLIHGCNINCSAPYISSRKREFLFYYVSFFDKRFNLSVLLKILAYFFNNIIDI